MWNFVALWCGFVAECDVLRGICVLLLENIGKNFKKYLEVRNNINTFAEILRLKRITFVNIRASKTTDVNSLSLFILLLSSKFRRFIDSPLRLKGNLPPPGSYKKISRQL